MTPIFIVGTDTNIGKTLVASWLCLHTGWSYFKPIQTCAPMEGTDSQTVAELSGAKIYPESYVYSDQVSPHLAAARVGQTIELEAIKLPELSVGENLIVEGAGGLLVPINERFLMIDLIKRLNLPVLLVASSRVGTINHTLLSLEALLARNIEVLGVIVSGELNADNCHAIEFYGRVPVLAQIPLLTEVSRESLKAVPLPKKLKQLCKIL